MKDFFIADAASFEGQSITTFFLLSSISSREGKTGKPYLALTLTDKSGQIDGRMWDDFAKLIDTCTAGCYIKVQGKLDKYNSKHQFIVTQMRPALANEIDTADFVPTSIYDIHTMAAELRGYVAAFKNLHLQRLVLSFLDDPKLGPAFLEAPAAKRLHHAWIGGLLEHVLCLVRVLLSVAPFYPEADPDLLVTGAILHDMGKVRELSWGSSFDYTLEGQLIGHISIGQGLLYEKIAQLDAEAAAKLAADVPADSPLFTSTGVVPAGADTEPFPPRLRLLLEHMILSHHGKLEFGSPKLPMTPEAMLLSAMDDLEAKFQTLRNEFAASKAANRSSADVTEWVRSMERPLFNSQNWLKAEEKP
jgi:3'-5' exoribonuclease